jgi:hypothetical protein
VSSLALGSTASTEIVARILEVKPALALAGYVSSTFPNTGLLAAVPDLLHQVKDLKPQDLMAVTENVRLASLEEEGPLHEALKVLEKSKFLYF